MWPFFMVTYTFKPTIWMEEINLNLDLLTFNLNKLHDFITFKNQNNYSFSKVNHFLFMSKSFWNLPAKVLTMFFSNLKRSLYNWEAFLYRNLFNKPVKQLVWLEEPPSLQVWPLRLSRLPPMTFEPLWLCPSSVVKDLRSLPCCPRGQQGWKKGWQSL